MDIFCERKILKNRIEKAIDNIEDCVIVGVNLAYMKIDELKELTRMLEHSYFLMKITMLKETEELQKEINRNEE